MEATSDPGPVRAMDPAAEDARSPLDRMRDGLLESGARFVETVQALKAAEAFGPIERGQAMELLCFTKTRMEPAMVECLLGRVPASPEEAMALLAFPVLHKAEALRRMKIVTEVTGKAIPDKAQWLARLQRGAKHSATQHLLWRMYESGMLDDIPPAPTSAENEVALSNAEPIIEALESGRNVILMGYHGNMPPITGPIESYLRERPIPRVIVANNATMPGPDGLYVDPLAPDFALQFAKVAKSLRTGGPRVVTIYPDGGQGASFRRFELAGTWASMALGAATLAYFGRAACFVCIPQPFGARMIAQYLPGYDVQPADSKESVEDRVIEAYREGFIETLRSDPARFDLWEGYWAILFRDRTAPPDLRTNLYTKTVQAQWRFPAAASIGTAAQKPKAQNDAEVGD